MREFCVVVFGILHISYERTFKEPEYARYFAASIITFLAIILGAVLVSLVLDRINPSLTIDFYKYYRFFGVIAVLSSWWYFDSDVRVGKIMEEYRGIKKSRRILFATILLIVTLLVFALFFRLSDEARAMNLML